MSDLNFDEVIERIYEEDQRFEKGAYYFVRQALDYTLQSLREKGNQRSSNHVSGGELLDGIRRFALQQYGPMTVTLFKHWGVTCCEDFGDIVFNLVDRQVLGKTKNDKKQDFTRGYSFEEAFEDPFLPPKLEESEDENGNN